MAKEEREKRDVYWVSLKEYNNGIRTSLKKEVFESASGALKRYEEWVLDYEKETDKQLLVDILYIHEGYFSTIKEFHLWERRECEGNILSSYTQTVRSDNGGAMPDM